MKKNIIIIGVSLVMSVLFVLTKSLSTSPLFYFQFLDSSIYQYMGFAMLQGKIPYTELFDHKGILIYWINAMGYWIHPQYGVAILQMMNLSLVLIVWSRLLSEYKQPVLKCFIMLISLLGISVYSEEGNLTEEWALFFISLPLMLWYKTRKNGTMEFDNQSMFLIGLCVGALLISRINNGISVLVMLMFCLAEALWLKKYNYIKRSIISFLIGFMILPVIACLFMYMLNGIKGVDDMIYATIGFNMEYAKESGFAGFVLWKDPKSTGTALLPLLFLFPMLKNSKRELWLIVLLYIITALSIGGRIYPHYFIVFIPLFVLFFAYISNSRIRYWAIPIMAVVIGFLSIHEIDIDFSREYTPSKPFTQIIKSVPESKRTEIWNMGGGLLACDFLKAGIIQKNRILLPFQLSVSKRLYDEENMKIQKVKPEYVIFTTCTSDFFRNLLRYSSQNNYQESDADYQFVQSNYKLISSATCENGTQLFCYQLIQ